jgi:hypothetical protein
LVLVSVLPSVVRSQLGGATGAGSRLPGVVMVMVVVKVMPQRRGAPG